MLHKSEYRAVTSKVHFKENLYKEFMNSCQLCMERNVHQVTHLNDESRIQMSHES